MPWFFIIYTRSKIVRFDDPIYRYRIYLEGDSSGNGTRLIISSVSENTEKCYEPEHCRIEMYLMYVYATRCAKNYRLVRVASSLSFGTVGTIDTRKEVHN